MRLWRPADCGHCRRAREPERLSASAAGLDELAAGARMTALAWGVKASFRAYVIGAGGRIELSGGAAEAGDGGFRFPAAEDLDLTFGDDGRPLGVGRFAGGVAFTAHGGLLSVDFSDPWVEAGPAGAGLSVADITGRRAVIATLDLAQVSVEPDGTVALPAAITLDGMMLIGDHYPPGTVLDPVRLVRR
jgi:hypothetical protein